uniref:Uncharacterized protein n=1 Tax=Mola mola TaxID=94237 RepID=A0A3Q4BEB5_MOLML
MKTLVVGVGGMTNGGKSTLAMSLHQQIPNSCIIAQDSYFKVGCGGVFSVLLDALHMDEMMRDVDSWRRDPESFLRRRGLNPERAAPSGKEVFVLIVEGFLIFNDRYRRLLNVLFDKRYFLEIPYEVCKRRRRCLFFFFFLEITKHYIFKNRLSAH